MAIQQQREVADSAFVLQERAERVAELRQWRANTAAQARKT